MLEQRGRLQGNKHLLVAKGNVIDDKELHLRE